MLGVHSIETFGTHEGPGIRLVVFLQGCPLRCLYCHNADTQALEDEGTQLYSSAQIVDLLERQRPFFSRGGGLTVSGGEATLQAEALLELFSEAKVKGFHTTLDTSGIIWSSAVNRLYDLADLVILDVKHIDNGAHRRLTGTGNGNVLRNAAYREAAGKPMWLRYVLVPGWTDQPEDLEAWAAHFAGYKTVDRVEILPYHTLGIHKYAALGRPYALDHVNPPGATQVEAAREIFARYLNNIVVL
jgi:pyruvate formate lyase activating enzyme